MTPVSDPAILAMLNGSPAGRQPVADPEILRQLNGPVTDAATLAALDGDEPEKHNEGELRSYEPTWRDRLAQLVMPDDPRKSPTWSHVVEGVLGSRGLGATGAGLVDLLPPTAAPLAYDEASRDLDAGRYGTAALRSLALIPAPAAGLVARTAATELAEEAAPVIAREIATPDPHLAAMVKDTSPVAAPDLTPTALPKVKEYNGGYADSDEINALVDSYNYMKETHARPKPESLASFLVRNGGIQNTGRDVSHLMGGFKGRPGLIAGEGSTLDDAALRAWEAGYFPEHVERPDINEFLDRLHDDLQTGTVVRRGDEAYFDDMNVADEMAKELDEYGIAGLKFRDEDELRAVLRTKFPQGEGSVGEVAQAQAATPRATTTQVADAAPWPEPAVAEAAPPFVSVLEQNLPRAVTGGRLQRTMADYAKEVPTLMKNPIRGQAMDWVNQIPQAAADVKALAGPDARGKMIADRLDAMGITEAPEKFARTYSGMTDAQKFDLVGDNGQLREGLDSLTRGYSHIPRQRDLAESELSRIPGVGRLIDVMMNGKLGSMTQVGLMAMNPAHAAGAAVTQLPAWAISKYLSRVAPEVSQTDRLLKAMAEALSDPRYAVAAQEIGAIAGSGGPQ